MIQDKEIVVNGLRVTLKPYSEKRYNQLSKFYEEQEQYFKDNPDIKVNEIPRATRAEWYRKRAEILWEPQVPYPRDFFESEEFEAGRLKDSEDFFVSRVAYL